MIAQPNFASTISTKLYMNGTVRSWIHYIQLRAQADTQLEHREIALQCREIFMAQLPEVARALGWTVAIDLTGDSL